MGADDRDIVISKMGEAARLQFDARKLMKAHVCWSSSTNLYHATLLGGEFDNCHGQGPTKEMAMISLRLTVRARRRSKVGKSSEL